MRLNRAVAVSEVAGLPAGMEQLEQLATTLDGYHAYHAARADLLRRLGDGAASRAAYDRAIALARNTAEAAYLLRRRDELL